MARQTMADTTQQMIEAGLAAGMLHLSASEVTGRHVWVDGQQLFQFGSCSYLGLEKHPKLIAGVIAAVERFGVQFSSSRGYMGVSLLTDLENRLSEMYDGYPVVCAPSTTMMHASAIPVLVRPEDAVLLDQKVHASVHFGVNHVRVQGVPVDVVPHNRIDLLREQIRALKSKHQTIWYFCESIYSMYGNNAPLAELAQLLAEEEQLYVYVDDAHGMSWTGKHGCGRAFEAFGRSLHERIVIAFSLNKAFACGGGAIVLPTKELAHRVRSTGPTLIFSGPLQPPMLGAAVASADLHLSPEITALQTTFKLRTEWARAAIEREGLPVFFEADGPILFVPVGVPATILRILQGVKRQGYFLDSAIFPAVPMKQGGIRITLTNHLERNDVDGMARCLATEYGQVMADEGISTDDLRRQFGCAAAPTLYESTTSATRYAFRLEVVSRAMDLNAQEWDSLFGARAGLDHRMMTQFEAVFPPAAQITEHHWRYRYIVVRDEAGKPVAATWCTVALMKADFLSSAHVSTKIEERRAKDPSYLVEPTLLLGSQLGLGDPLYLDQGHPEWERALAEVLACIETFREETGANLVALRDFPDTTPQTLVDRFFNLGFARHALPDSFSIDIDWSDDAGYLRRFPDAVRRARVRKIMDNDERFEVRVLQAHPGPTLAKHCYDLYRQVQARSLVFNTFPMPFELFEMFYSDPRWELILLYPREEGATLLDGAPAPVAAGICTLSAYGTYQTLMVGLDYERMPKGTYDQVLLRAVRRAQEVGAKRIELGFTAELNKRRLGGKRTGNLAFVAMRDHYAALVMETV